MQNGGSMDFALLVILIVAMVWYFVVLVAERKYRRELRRAQHLEKVKSVLGE